MKNIVLLGSTGSIGTQTLDVVRHYKEDFRVTALAAASNIERLEEQIREFRPKTAVVYREDKARELKEKVSDMPVEVLAGMDGLLAAAAEPSADIVLTAVVGMIGIRPTIAAIEAGKVRLRPILMTSFAFILGVFPLVISTGAGAASRISLGIAVFAGMLMTSLVGTLFMPNFYYVMQSLQERLTRKKQKS